MAEDDVELLPAVAQSLIDWLPELNGRALAVTEAEVTKTNIPTLPVAVVAPLRQDYVHGGGLRMSVTENFVIEFWLEPAREKGEGFGETAFWSYYEYNKFRDRLLSRFAKWRGPGNSTLRFVSFDVDANELAVIMTFRFAGVYDWCASVPTQDPCDPQVHEDGNPMPITFGLCVPRSPACLETDQLEQKEEPDPCP